MSVFNGEFKRYNKVLEKIEVFKKKNPQFEQYEALLAEKKESETGLKGAAKDEVKKTGEKFEGTHTGIEVKAWPVKEDVFNLKQEEAGQWVKFLYRMDVLSIDSKAYKTRRTDGQIPPQVDKLIRSERVKQISSSVKVKR